MRLSRWLCANISVYISTCRFVSDKGTVGQRPICNTEDMFDDGDDDDYDSRSYREQLTFIVKLYVLDCSSLSVIVLL